MSYRAFEVVGIELEYPMVDAELQVQHLVEPLFRELAGRPCSDVSLGGVEMSNELADHVFEIKTAQPEKDLTTSEKLLAAGVKTVCGLAREKLGATLLPTAMHPFFDPRQGRTWRRAGRPIYEAYAGLFELQRHGWMNVQSCHVNLPFGDEEETVAMHNASACLLPYLPALTASSPLYEDRLGPLVDNRLGFYRSNQARFPEVTGDVVPEYIRSLADYRTRILEPIYRRLRQTPGAERLRHEWMNSRGVILRFMRSAMEVRVLDTQECVKMDAACAAFVRAALRVMTSALREGRLRLPEQGLLVADFGRVVAEGRKAEVEAPHLREWLGLSSRHKQAGAVMQALVERASEALTRKEAPYAALVVERLAKGNLSERIRRKLERSADAHGVVPRERTVALYRELAACLEANEVWVG
ncbi:MAG: glutamate-cysteine ligase family protein [Bryobacterales bacterium]